jgi:hypothetical protein
MISSSHRLARALRRDELLDAVHCPRRDATLGAEPVKELAVVHGTHAERRLGHAALLDEGFDLAKEGLKTRVHVASPLRGFPPACQGNFTLIFIGAILWENPQVNQSWTLADEIRRRMNELGLNPKRLSLGAGLNETYVRDIIKGRTRNPRTDTLGKLARALRCSRADLLPPAERSAEASRELVSGLDPVLLSRALAVAERLAAEDKTVASEIASVVYRLIERERDGQPITDDEATLRVLEEFVRRIHRAAETFR